MTGTLLLRLPLLAAVFRSLDGVLDLLAGGLLALYLGGQITAAVCAMVALRRADARQASGMAVS